MAVVCGCSLVAVPAGGAVPGARFGLLPVVGVELALGVWGFQGWWRRGGSGVWSRCGAVSLLCWWAVVSHVPGWGRGLRCGMLALGCVVAFPMGWGASCPGLVGSVVARGWSSGGVRQSHAVSRSSLWHFPVRGPRGIVAVRGLGSPGAGCVGLECRNQGGVAAWFLGVSAHR